MSSSDNKGTKVPGEIPTELVLYSERCQLRQPNVQDIAHVWSATRERGFNDGMLWDPPTNIGELTAPLHHGHKLWTQGLAYTFTAELANSGEFVGRVSIRQEHQQLPASGKHINHHWSIGFWIHPSVQKQGYAQEIAGCVMQWGFDVLGAELISAAHATWNEASARVLQHLGMHRVRHTTQGFKKAGQWVAEYECELPRTAYYSTR